MDLQKAIRIAVETGKTKMGSNQGITLALKGGAKLMLISNNCQKEVKEEIIHAADKSKTPYYETNFTSMEIGSICGKPFPVSILSILDPGNSEVMRILEKGVSIETEVTEERETRAATKKREKAMKKERSKESLENGEGKETEDNEGKSVEAEQ